MKMYLKTTVLEESLNRIRRLYDDFENVMIGMSGGKDSTVLFHLTMQVAEERGRLPLRVLWIDQEAEWQGTVDYMESIFADPRVEQWWFQIPMKWYHNLSTAKDCISIWDAEREADWIRPKVASSFKENIYLPFGFHEIFDNILRHHFPDTRTALLSGLRAEESPKRHMALTYGTTYKDITWGAKIDVKRGHYNFHPMYDWSYTDVWKYIHDNGWSYNRVYDGMYSHGVPVLNMRISNLHHETAIQCLLLVQELEPDTWNRVTKRISEVNVVKHLQRAAFQMPKELPYMFKSWQEYAEHLADNLIVDPKHRAMLDKHIESNRKYFITVAATDAFYREVITTILVQDWDFTKIKNISARPEFGTVVKFVNGKINAGNYKENKKYDKYIKGLI